MCTLPKHSQTNVSRFFDGADQTKFSIPHFTSAVNDQRGHGLGVNLFRILNHKSDNRLGFFTMTKKRSTCASHVIGVVHRFLNQWETYASLPPKLIVQLYNCWLEKMKRYFLTYMESLIQLGLFEETYVIFIPIGHTHVDKECVNCSSLCDKSNYLWELC